MAYSQEEYTRYYIEQALFKLMNEYEFEKISVTDIVNKAGVGRATFYRYFKRKEDIIVYYFEHNKQEFMLEQHYYPRCKDDYIQTVTKVLTCFKQHKSTFKLIKNAHLEYIYLDYLNKNFIALFKNEFADSNEYAPYLYAGMLFNVSMAYLESGCSEPIEPLAETIINTIYFK